jgi:hypothetical protein
MLGFAKSSRIDTDKNTDKTSAVARTRRRSLPLGPDKTPKRSILIRAEGGGHAAMQQRARAYGLNFRTIQRFLSLLPQLGWQVGLHNPPKRGASIEMKNAISDSAIPALSIMVEEVAP